MKKVLLIAIFTFVMAAVQSVSAQTRIQFEKGKSSATVKGSTGNNGIYYMVRAKGGQKITVTLAPTSNIGIKIEGDDGANVLLREERGGTYTVYLEEGGDFSIFVGSINHKPVAFTLTVKITKMADI